VQEFIAVHAFIWTVTQILGVSVKAEKDEIVKTVMELKNTEIEEGYTADVPTARQVWFRNSNINSVKKFPHKLHESKI
jgi:hypothetical protein